jgi:hypothetical protein
MKKAALFFSFLAFGMSANAHSDTVYIVKHDTVFVDRPLQEPTSGQQTSMTNGNVPFTLARNYFVRNDTKFRGSKLIDKAEDFEAIFGKAATMGEGGTPTPIDFNRQCVLVIVRPETNAKTEITPGRLTADDENLRFSYNILQGRDQSFSTIPMLILIIDKAYYRLNVSVSSRVKHLTIDDDPDAVLQGVYD